ncbi:MAG: cytochrome c [Candidatus Thiodiazotropha sp.]
MKTSLLAGTALVLSLSGAVSQAGEVEKAVEYRQGAMEVFSWNMKGMGDMMKGEKPYDAARLAVMAKDLESATQLDLLSGFPTDSESSESDALPEIWMDFDDFKSKYQDLREAAKALNAAVAGGDKAAIGAALKDTGGSCKACHKKYKK